MRSKEAAKLQKDMIEALTDLNFLDVKFEIQVRKKEEITAIGSDDVEFMISTNPGEPLKSLRQCGKRRRTFAYYAGDQDCARFERPDSYHDL